jgi:hypothetical protein
MGKIKWLSWRQLDETGKREIDREFKGQPQAATGLNRIHWISVDKLLMNPFTELKIASACSGE